MQSTLYGYRLIENPDMVDVLKVQKRKHHKKRINKKWQKIYGYNLFEKPSQNVLCSKSNNIIVAHPETIKVIIKNLNS